MARIRTIKPDFFRHELLQELESQYGKLKPMLVFVGLWTLCDKNGVFEWRPRQLKLDILPFVDFSMQDTLQLLEKYAFVVGYEVDGKQYGIIPSFNNHQRITGTEAKAEGKRPLPDTETLKKQQGNTSETLKKQQGRLEREKEREKERERIDTHPKKSKLIPLESPEYQISEFLFNEILKLNPNHKPPNLKAWAKDIDLMIRIDNRRPEDIRAVIAWVQTDPFWQCNILSAEKLRKNFDTLKIKMEAQKRGNNGGNGKRNYSSGAKPSYDEANSGSSLGDGQPYPVDIVITE